MQAACFSDDERGHRGAEEGVEDATWPGFCVATKF